MKVFLSILMFIIISCNNSVNKKDVISNSIIDSLSIKKNTYLVDTILVNNNLNFTISTTYVNNDLILLNSANGGHTTLLDTIHSNGLFCIKFIDFNNDKNSDVLIDYFGNNSTYFLYLFDKKTNTFKNIKDYLNFPDAIQLKSNPVYYYSYNRAGCADENWESDLFQIINFSLIQLGHIDGHGCDSQDIKIYKIMNNDKEVLIEKKPYYTVIIDSIDKWEYLEKYWNKNYKKFK
jgi:hypothetical protein